MKLNVIEAFCKNHHVEVSRGNDWAYTCDVDGMTIGLGETAIEAIKNAINQYATNPKIKELYLNGNKRK